MKAKRLKHFGFRKHYRETFNGFDIYCPKLKQWLSFYMSEHARARAIQRGIEKGAIMATLLNVSHLLHRVISKYANQSKVIFTDYRTGAAVLVALKQNGGTVITVLNYHTALLPEDVPIVDRRLFTL